MTLSLATSLEKSLEEVTKIETGKENELLEVIERYPA